MTDGQKFKVIAVLNEYRLVVSAGEGDVVVGDRLEVVEQGPEIRDPETGLVLGHLSTIKARVRVTQVESRFSVALTDETERKHRPKSAPKPHSPFAPDSPLGGLFDPPEETVPKKLKIRPEDAIGFIYPSDAGPIVPGDIVRLLPRTS